jgi:hypothetical protein
MLIVPPWIIEDQRPRSDERADRRRSRLELPSPMLPDDDRRERPWSDRTIVIEVSEENIAASLQQVSRSEIIVRSMMEAHQQSDEPVRPATGAHAESASQADH